MPFSAKTANLPPAPRGSTSILDCRWMSARRAASYLDITVPTLYQWGLDGTLPGIVRITRRTPKGTGRHRVSIRVDRLAVDRWLESRVR